MDYDIGIVRRRRIISADECFFAAPATAAGPSFPTWDPATAGSDVALSNGNLTATSIGAAANSGVSSTIARNTGKRYVETTWFNVVNSNVWLSALFPTVTSFPTGYVFGNNQGNWLVNNVDSGVAAQNIGITGGTFVVGTAIDFVNSRIWAISTNVGLWNGAGGADPASNVGGADFSAAVTGGNSFFFAANVNIAAGEVATVNFGATAYNGSLPGVPAGFTNW